ncbi:hypothetical protein GQ44DRAFT_832733 [Phaeosphaeriaceae sp. PMI808]|nr:hypothetical protein GQ44DRAFT_832733 [Phaeosphaeriaceae sp. PMI808]
MTKAMAAHHGPKGIRVNSVCAGAVFTPMAQGDWMTAGVRQSRIDKTMLKSEGTGWHIGYATLFLLCKEARWITAQNIVVDGSTTAGQTKPTASQRVLAVSSMDTQTSEPKQTNM